MSNIVVGKDVIELLGSAMYRDPLSIYREYIQNAVDSIDDAVKDGLLKDASQSKIDISIDNIERIIRIRDNGTGVSKQTFKRKMLSIGASGKRASSARGFRGIGRLSGLGYCQELIFRTRAKGQDVSQLKWNIRAIKKALSDTKNNADLAKLIAETTEFQSFPSDEYPEHFFEVEMVKPLRLGGDILLNLDRVKHYLSQVAPVPFSDDFTLAKQIRSHLQENGGLHEYNIFINDSEDALCKAYRDTISFSETKKGSFTGNLDLIAINDANGDLSATGWIAHSDYQGAIPPRSLVGGLRARVGNLQIGERDLFVDAFPEPRFNSWSVGEIYIISKKIIPNGRRDGFEQNKQLSDLQIRLLPYCHDIAKQCRRQSALRNTHKRVESLLLNAQESIDVLNQKVLSSHAETQRQSQIRGYISEIEDLLSRDEVAGKQFTIFEQKLDLVKINLDVSEKSKNKSPTEKMTREEKALLHRFCELVYECSSNQASAKLLIDKVLVRL